MIVAVVFLIACSAIALCMAMTLLLESFATICLHVPESAPRTAAPEQQAKAA